MMQLLYTGVSRRGWLLLIFELSHAPISIAINETAYRKLLYSLKGAGKYQALFHLKKNWDTLFISFDGIPGQYIETAIQVQKSNVLNRFNIQTRKRTS